MYLIFLPFRRLLCRIKNLNKKLFNITLPKFIILIFILNMQILAQWNGEAYSVSVPSEINANKQFYVETIVHNNGQNSNSYELKVLIYNSNDTFINSKSTKKYSVAAGEYKNTNFAFTISQIGSYYAIFEVWEDKVGGTKYDSKTSNTFQIVSTPKLTISVSPSTTQTKDWGGSVSYSITVKDNNGNNVSGAVVGITDNLVSLSTQISTNSSGQATYKTTVPNNKTNNTYSIDFTATKNGYDNSSKVTRYVKVEHTPKLIISVSPSTTQTKNWGESVNYTVTVQDDNGSNINGAVVGITDNLMSQSAQTSPTNSNGQTTYKTTVPNGKSNNTYGIDFTATKNGYDNSSKVTRYVKVEHRPKLTISISPPSTQTKNWGESVTYSITVKDDNGNNISGAVVGITDNLMSQSAQTSPTNSNGQTTYKTTVPNAKPDGTYGIDFISTKSGYDNSSTVTRYVKIEHRPKLTISISPSSTQTKDWGESVNYTITVQDDNGNNISGAIVGIIDNLMSQSAQTSPTNSNGQTTYKTTVPNAKPDGTYGIDFIGTKSGYDNSSTVTSLVKVGKIELIANPIEDHLDKYLNEGGNFFQKAFDTIGGVTGIVQNNNFTDCTLSLKFSDNTNILSVKVHLSSPDDPGYSWVTPNFIFNSLTSMYEYRFKLEVGAKLDFKTATDLFEIITMLLKVGVPGTTISPFKELGVIAPQAVVDKIIVSTIDGQNLEFNKDIFLPRWDRVVTEHITNSVNTGMSKEARRIFVSASRDGVVAEHLTTSINSSIPKGVRKINVLAPVDFYLQDDQSRITGMYQGNRYSDIPNSFASGDGELETIFLYGKQDYNVTLKGTENGTFDFINKKIFVDNPTDSITIKYENVKVTPSTICFTKINDTSNNNPLKIDNDGDGVIDSTIQPSDITIVDLIDIPQNLISNTKGQQIELTWSANTESDLARYRIYRSTFSPATTLIDSVNVPDTSYTDNNVTNGIKYYYRITAVENSGNESGFSNEVNVTITGENKLTLLYLKNGDPNTWSIEGASGSQFKEISVWESAGYNVTKMNLGSTSITSSLLSNYNVLRINGTSHGAITEAEGQAIYNWVQNGGNLIAEVPFTDQVPGVKRFGVSTISGQNGGSTGLSWYYYGSPLKFGPVSGIGSTINSIACESMDRPVLANSNNLNINATINNYPAIVSGSFGSGKVIIIFVSAWSHDNTYPGNAYKANIFQEDNLTFLNNVIKSFEENDPSQIDLTLTINDGANGNQTLNYGLNPNATDEIDTALGEQSLPPLPPSGIFDARFILPNNENSLKDYRNGDKDFSGTKEYLFQYQPGSGNNITITWDLPQGITGRLQDVILGTIINVTMDGAGSYTVTNPSSFNKLKMTINYNSMPTVPELISPLNESIGVSITPKLIWHSSKNTDTYGLQVSTNSSFTSIIINDTTLTDTTKTINSLNGSTTYYWRVNAKNTEGKSNYSEIFNFTTKIKALTDLSINIIDSGNETQILNYGLDPSATDGIDINFGEQELPPLPPSGVFDARFILPTQPSAASLKDYRDTTTTKTIDWKLYFQPGSGGYPITVSWEPSTFPSGNFKLMDVITGSLINIDMKMQNSYELTNSGINTLKIEYSNTIILDFDVVNGWNIISVPLLTTDMSKVSLFPTSTSPAFSFNNGSSIADTLENGKGYWLKFPSIQSIQINGTPVTKTTISVISGWNLIGGYDKSLLVNNITSTPSGIISSSFFGYNNGYYTADTLKPGKGYWLKASQNGVLNISSALAKGKVNESVLAGTIKKDWGRIIVRDASSKNNVLYISKDIGKIDKYELPPKPPKGVFDVRFSGSNSYVENMTGTKEIEISTDSYPVTISISNMKGIRIYDKTTGGKLIDKTISEGSEIVISNKSVKSLVVEEKIIPTVFSLEQNYPNPFNPSTTIKYGLPENTRVRLTLYNTLGQKVEEILNQEQEAGYHKIIWNGSKYASGVYIYRIETGRYSNAKKLLLLK